MRGGPLMVTAQYGYSSALLIGPRGIMRCAPTGVSAGEFARRIRAAIIGEKSNKKITRKNLLEGVMA
jgi:hypothetical protein